MRWLGKTLSGLVLVGLIFGVSYVGTPEAGPLRQDNTQIITGTVIVGNVSRTVSGQTEYAQDLDSRAFHILPFPCDVKKVSTYIDTVPTTDVTVIFKNGVAGTSMATHTHSWNLSVPNATNTLRGNITRRSFAENGVLEINTASAATNVSTISYTVTCDGRPR